jgi:hypothetical protein
VLEEERRFYDEHLAEWLERYAERFVVVKGRELVAVTNTVDEALAEGARRFGLSPFLVRRVQSQPEIVTIPALTLGLLHADFASPVRGPENGA